MSAGQRCASVAEVPTRLTAKLGSPSMRRLLEERKAGLEWQIAQRHREARQSGTTANVKLLSATLRAVKRQIKQAGDG